MEEVKTVTKAKGCEAALGGDHDSGPAAGSRLWPSTGAWNQRARAEAQAQAWPLMALPREALAVLLLVTCSGCASLSSGTALRLQWRPPPSGSSGLAEGLLLHTEPGIIAVS